MASENVIGAREYAGIARQVYDGQPPRPPGSPRHDWFSCPWRARRSPDRHLILEDGRAYIWRGPKENQYRPAVNALFRSAAVAFTSRVIGVVLSGAMEDGATGLWWIKQYGGKAIIQDPNDARFPGMPTTALETSNRRW